MTAIDAARAYVAGDLTLADVVAFCLDERAALQVIEQARYEQWLVQS